MAARQTEWPSFADVFLASVVEAMRPRSDDLWIRGRLFIDGENDRGATEWLVVEIDIRPRRSITMRCDPGGFATLTIRGTGRSDSGRPLFTSGRVRVVASSERLVRGYEDVISAVFRSPAPSGFAENVRALWLQACGS